MATKGLWILLFVAVQVSVGFCRSTETPIKNLKDIAQVIDPADLSKILELQNAKGVDVNVTQHYPTGIPDIAQVIDPADLPKILEVLNSKVVDVNDTQHYPTGIPGKLDYDTYTYREYDISYRDAVMNAYIITAIVISVFTVLSFVLGCICICCCKKEPRRGFVINSAGGQITAMQQPATNPSGFVQPIQQSATVSSSGFPMQQYPSNQAKAQQQNIYPHVPATQ